MTKNNNYYNILVQKGGIDLKIIINYDLLEKIQEAKHGLALVKTSKRVLLKATITEMVYMLLTLFENQPIETLSESFVRVFCWYLFFHFLLETTDVKQNKTKALEEIKKLAIQLNDLNICTEQKLLMDSYIYEKEYELENEEDSILPKICQKKYIMVPVYDDGEINEVSLLQEHIIGTKSYVISYGKPNKQKVFKPAFGSI